ncbi:26S protease regulatory subunit 8 protein [Trichinella spiralis]|uniref:26S protease regulatory subunit 8 protein n=1 Tax=Trichinella spiralis TaxID=6334 RepID=UPI0001EFED71|nr:26S protease regulatory subunit 8 protein [Trichinella spiralis]
MELLRVVFKNIFLTIHISTVILAIGNKAFELSEKSRNLRRLTAQRNELNAKVRMLKEELSLLHEQGSYVGEVVRVMDKKKVLVKASSNVHPEGKLIHWVSLMMVEQVLIPI